MITDIPTPDELADAGQNLLNLAWTTAVDLLRALRSDNPGIEYLREHFLEKSQTALTNALAVIDQGQDLLLKARIAVESPFLLFADPARTWPSGCDKRDMPFYEFKTISGDDLLRAHNAVVAARLDDEFAQFYGEMRRLRNIIIHKGTGLAQIEVAEIFVHILKVCRFLLPDKRWLDIRRAYLNNHPATLPWDQDFYSALLAELDVIVDCIGRRDLLTYFQFDKKARRYICPMDCGGKFAQLRPNEPTSAEVYCFVCDGAAPVSRRDCEVEGCPSNVICDERCLVCGAYTRAFDEQGDEPYESPSQEEIERLLAESQGARRED